MNTEDAKNQPAIDYDGPEWLIALWPDGTWCDLDEVESYLTWKSDDYQVHRVLSHDEGYCPCKTEPTSTIQTMTQFD